MGLSLKEVYQNAEFNLSSSVPFQILIGKEQLRNYEIAIELGAKEDDDWYDWEEKVEEFKHNT